MKFHIESVLNKAVKDVLVTGYLDTGDSFTLNSCPVFHPMYDRLYFVFEDFISEFFVDEKGIVCINTINKIECWFDIDEDDQFSVMSIFAQLFKTESNVTISSIKRCLTPFSNIAIVYTTNSKEQVLSLHSGNLFGFTWR